MTAAANTDREVARCVDAVLRSRRSVRAYQPTPIARELVLEVLEVAATAPSNSNTQPWQVHVLTGAPKDALAEILVDAFQKKQFPPSRHFPDPLPTPYDTRQSDFAARYYGSLEIDRQDAIARAQQTQRNFSFFSAPVGLIITIDARLHPHSWLDLGLFVQSIMIAARARGLDTCPQVSFAQCHAILASHLQMPAEQVTVCGMAMGIADPDAKVNQCQMPRESIDNFVRLIGFDT